MLVLLPVGVLLLAALLIALTGPTAIPLTQRFRILAATMRLDSGEFTVAEIRAKCTDAAAKLIDLRSVAPDKRDDTWAINAKAAAAELHDYNALEERAARDQRAQFEQLVWDDAVAEAERRAANPNERGGRGPDGAFDDIAGEYRTAGQLLTESDAYKAAVAEGSRTMQEVEVRNLLTGSSLGTSGSHLLAPVGQPFMSTPSLRRMRFFVRDLLPVQGTTLQSIPYVRELNAATTETGATTVSEASAKPEVTMTFESADAPVRKIAAWIQVTEEAFADAPTLRGYVENRLAYMLMVEEEDQVLNGNGTAPNIRGILQTSGIQTQTAVTDDLAATIGLAAAKIENVDGFMDGVAINPVTYWTGVVERHSSQMDGGATDAGLPFRDIPATIWGGPVVRTRALAVNKAVVGCWGLGGTIFERAGTTIRTTDSHASLFISNTLVVLAEKRTALAVFRPDYFVDTTLAFT